MNTRKIIAIVCVLAFGLAALPVIAATSPQQKLMAKRAAELDAYRKMAERIMGLELTSTTQVRDFVTESDQIAASLDHFIKGVRFSDVRYYDDGVCEADAEVTIQQVVTTLKQITDEVYKGGKWHKDTFDSIEKKTVKKIIAVTGCGAIRPETEIEDPAMTPIVAPLAAPRMHSVHLPAIYRQYPPNQRLMAKRAAEVDAYRMLIERVYGLQIESGTLVRDFCTETDQINAATQGKLKGARTTNIRYQPDGVVEVEMQITISQVVTTVKQVYDEVYRGGKWHKDTFDQIEKQTSRKVIAVVGVGALNTTGNQDSGKTRTSQTINNDEVIIIE